MQQQPPAWNPLMDEINTVEELSKLRRIYRISKSERKAYQRDIVVTLLKQKAIIDKLEHEKEEILLKLSLDCNRSREKRDGEEAEKLYDVYKEKRDDMHRLRTKTEQQRKQMYQAEKEMRKLKCENNDSHLYQKILQNSKRVRSLEDRLENAFGRYNRLSHKMGIQRERIGHLVHQRNTYKNVWQQMYNSLSESRRKMDELMTSANHNYNKREELYQRFQVMKLNQKQERKMCWAQLQEAERSLVNQSKIANFMAVKNKKRNVQEAVMADRPSRLAMALRAMYSTVDESGSNFELFNFGCNLCSKYETLQAEVSKLKEAFVALRELDNQSAQRSESSCRDLEDQSAVLASESLELEKYVNQLKKSLPSLKSGLESMISAVGGDPQILSSLEPDSEDPTSKSLLVDALQEIENRVNNLLHTKLFFDSQMKERETSLQLHSTVSGSAEFIQSFRPIRRSDEQMDMIHISIPKLDDTTEFPTVHSSDLDVQPLTIESLRHKDQFMNLDRLKLL